jgi:hypothetical protein
MAKTPIILTDQIIPPPALVRAGLEMLPAAIAAYGERASRRFIEFFTATVCDDHRLGLEDIEPIAIATYIEELGSEIW